MNFREVDTQAQRLAHGLLALGLQRGDHIAAQLYNSLRRPTPPPESGFDAFGNGIGCSSETPTALPQTMLEVSAGVEG